MTLPHSRPRPRPARRRTLASTVLVLLPLTLVGASGATTTAPGATSTTTSPANATAPTTTAAPSAPVIDIEETVKANPIDPAKGASVVEVLRGTQASVNVWQITGDMPSHLHREHEEVIIVRSGRARARIGDRTVDLGPGDVFIVPKNTVHAARAYGEDPFVGVSVFAPTFDGKDRVPTPEATP